MKHKVLIISLIAILSMILISNGVEMREHIKTEGQGSLIAETNLESANDNVNSNGDYQEYTRVFSTENIATSFNTNYIYKNEKNAPNNNSTRQHTPIASGRYSASMTMWQGIKHSLSISSDTYLDGMADIDVDEEMSTGQTYYEFDATNGNLSEKVTDYKSGSPRQLASANVRGDLSIVSELSDASEIKCTPQFMMTEMDSIVMGGESPRTDFSGIGVTIYSIAGKLMPDDAQASYLQYDAVNMIERALVEADATKARRLYEQALQTIERALELNPGDARGWSNKGVVLFKMNRTREANEAYDRAITQDPQNSIALFGKAETLYAMKEYKDSIKTYNTALALDPSNAAGWYKKSYAHYRLKKFDEALLAINEYLNLTETADGYFHKAWILFSMKNYTDSIVAWDDGLSMCETKPPYEILNQGIAYYHLGMKKEAIQHFNDAKKYDKTTKIYEEANIWINRTNQLQDIREDQKTTPLVTSLDQSNLTGG